MLGDGFYNHVTAMIDCHIDHMIRRLPIAIGGGGIRSFPLAARITVPSAIWAQPCLQCGTQICNCLAPRPTRWKAAYLHAVCAERLRLPTDGVIFLPATSSCRRENCLIPIDGGIPRAQPLCSPRQGGSRPCWENTVIIASGYNSC